MNEKYLENRIEKLEKRVDNEASWSGCTFFILTTLILILYFSNFDTVNNVVHLIWINIFK